MVEPFINLKGMASEAIDFYEGVFGGTDKKIMRFSDMPGNTASDNMHGWVAHGIITLCGTVFHFSDTRLDVTAGTIVSLMLHFDTIEELMQAYQKLSSGGETLMEPQPQFYAKMYTWVKDKFDVEWQLICEK